MLAGKIVKLLFLQKLVSAETYERNKDAPTREAFPTSSPAPTPDTLYDVIVVGGGPMGLSAAYECAKAGKKVLVLERFVLYNQSGSSNDLVRMFRTMYTEDFMADLAFHANDAWKVLEQEAGTNLIQRSGLLNFGDPNFKTGPEGNLLAPIKNLERLGMKYQNLTVDQIQEQFPFHDLPPNYQGLWAPDNGCINVSEMLRQLVRLCKKHGVEIRQWAKVVALDTSNENKVNVHAIVGEEDITKGAYEIFSAKKSIMTAGAYSNQILDASFNFKLDLDIWEMEYAYYAVDSTLEYPATPGAHKDTVEGQHGKPFKSMWFQFAANDDGDPNKSNLFYGFPTVPWGIKDNARIAVDSAVRRIKDPSERQIGASPFDVELTRKFVEKHLRGVTLQPNFAGSCLQTNVYDNMFVLDYLPPDVPNNQNVAIFTAGWGMKFVPLIGIILKELVVDSKVNPHYDISHFNITRSGPGKGSVIAKSGSPGFSTAFSNLNRGSSHHVSLPAKKNKTPFTREAYAKKLAPNLTLKPKVSSVVVDADGKILDFDNQFPDVSVEPLSVGILGGGISGLYAAILLKDINLKCKIEILEANPNRLGGRVFTKYFGNAKLAEPGSSEYYNYFDVGAMRLPGIPIHDRVIGKQRWSLVSYLNRNDQQIKVKPYYLTAKNTMMYYNNILKKGNVEGPDPFHYNVMKGKKLSYEVLLDAVVGTFKTIMHDDFDKGFEALMKVDHMSVRSYMRTFLQQKKLSDVTFEGKYTESIIDFIETFDSSSDMYNMASITETVIDNYDFSYAKNVNWHLIDGGTSRLIDGMENILESKQVKISTGAKVTKISKATTGQVEVTWIQKGKKNNSFQKTKSYDHVISTLPLGVLQGVDTVDLNFSTKKREAIRSLHYDNACKVGIQFENRFWQDTDQYPINGGSSTTDLPSRTIVYPSYGDKDSPGVLIASYTWTQDAARMAARTHEDRVRICLNDLERIHGSIVRNQTIIDSYSHSYYEDSYTEGAFALFGPAQFSTLFDSIIEESVDGRLHFAGEATSVHHAWIVGALNSAYRTVVEILMKLPEKERKPLQIKLEKRWGKVKEINIEDL